METPSRSLDILDNPWILRVYKKQKAIQIKPPHNKHIHFSIIWGNDIAPEDFATMEKEIRAFLAKTPKLSFRIIRPCANCTYGRFDESFEDLIMGFRKRFEGISAKKDLPLENEEHQDLRLLLNESHDPWNEEHPIIFHIQAFSKKMLYEGGEPDLVDITFQNLMKSDRNTVVSVTFSEKK
jgi:hypothetical protein